MVICLFYSHRIADGSSLVNFVKIGQPQLVVAAVGKPCYIFSSMFPPTTSMSFGDQARKKKHIQIVTRRFVFKDSSIAKLKKKCIPEVKANNGFNILDMDVVDHRFKVKQMDDAVCPVNVVNAVSAPKQVQYIATITINLRTRTIPPLPANMFGNMNDVSCCRKLVSKIKNSIKLVDNEHVKILQSNFAISCNKLKINQKLGKVIRFSSRCRFPIYEADVGWGKPTWASISQIPRQNFVMFMDSKFGGWDRSMGKCLGQKFLLLNNQSNSWIQVK
ncbi:hypothetical protein MKX01_033318 [Papaver californicum]|nr:hypothetical protein MKX01_033318 [Papaver californicum]